MPQLPPAIWFALGAGAIVLLAIAVAGPAGVLRSPVARARASALSGRMVMLLLLLATVPWFVVWQLPVQIEVNITSNWLLVLWLFVILGAFTLLVPLPLAAVCVALVWSLARRARRREGADSVAGPP